MNTTVLDRSNEKRFKSGIEAQKQLLDLTRVIQDALLINLPSNYSKDQNTNLAEFYRAVAKEFARLQISGSDINEDKYHTQTRPEYLFQILGDSLFLGSKSINENLSDVAYRNFLIRVRNAYYGGSRKDNIESAVSDIVGLPVILREVYLDLRKEASFYGLKDTHKMFFDIIMDEVTSASSIGIILEDLKFFIDLIKPAHVLYDTRLIWNEEFLNRPATCTPSYILENMEYEVYGTSKIDLVTYLSTSIYKYESGDPDPEWLSGTIASIDSSRGIFYLVEDQRILVYNSATIFYTRDETGDTVISVSSFSAGDAIKYYATKDSATSSEVIDTDWEYSGVIENIYESDSIISLTDGSLIVYNTDTLVYTRDYNGEYRIDLTDLPVNREIVFKAEKFTRSFQFYRTPEEIQNNFFKQFDSSIIAKPSFDEYVKKNKDIPEGMTEGYEVVVEDGIAVVKKIYSKFYKRENAENYRETKKHNYSLYIADEFEKQFHINDAARTLTENEAKSVFMNTYGYTGLQDSTDYRIDIATTGELVKDGASSILQAIDTQTQFCDRKAMCQLVPYYEDTRKYFTWPDIVLTSGFFTTEHIFPDTNPPENAQDLSAYYYVSADADPNNYQAPLLPMLGPDGEPAEVADLIVYLNGRLVTDAIATIDPWLGIVTLNFLPPFDTTLRIDYYHSKRYPGPVYYLKQIIPETIQVLENDFAGIFGVINVGGEVRRLTWPFEVTDPTLYGDDRDYQVNKFPMLTNKGELATKDDVDVFVGTVIAQGNLLVLTVSDDSSTLQSAGIDLTDVSDGDTVVLRVRNYLDETLIYVIESVGVDTITVPAAMPGVGNTYEASILHFEEIVGAVDDVRPLLGHVRINFLPPLNSFIRFNYYYTPYERNYLMVPDRDVVVNPDTDYGSSSYTPDTLYGSKNNYTLMVDQNPEYANQPYWNFDELLKVGYRYRAFNLAHTNALNSEQMILNDFDMYKDRASFANRNGVLNRYSLTYSPEFLYDTDKNVVLNDKYLYKDLTPQTVLSPGVPLFIDTFTDDGHFVRSYHAAEEETFDPDLVGGRDLQAGFTIIEPDNSGIIDSNSVCEYPDKKKINLYSDLKVVEYPNDGYDAHLTTIDEGGTSLPFKFTFIDQYYPDRELRLTDYLDYINQVPTEYRSGNVKVLQGSTVVKSIERNFRVLNVGDMLTIKNIPYEIDVGYTGYVGYSGPQDLLGYVNDEVGSTGETGFDVRRYRDDDHTVVQVVDFETAVVHKKFAGPGSSYAYELTRSKTYAVDTYLGKVNRTVVLNGDLNHTYSLPIPVLQALPGYGETGVHFELYFRDPDLDPYPRNPDNPWISNPTGIYYYDIPETIIDGKIYRTNRTKGVTGIVRTSQIIDAEGNSVGYTGYAAGVTGPSGALDLGITGPVGYPNPRIFEECDVYQVPSGETGIFLSYSEAEYRVQWRNWDQDMIIVTLGVSGIISENPVNLMNDIGDGIKRSFWDVANGVLREIRFHGTIIETCEKVLDSVTAASYPQGMILLTQDQEDVIEDAVSPVTELPSLHLGDTSYKLYRMIIREIMQDGLVNITEIQRFLPL